MKIFIVGGTGFVGRYVVKELLAAGHQVTALVRSSSKVSVIPPGADHLVGNPMVAGDWQNAISDFDVIINFAGANIFCRWTAENKKLLYESRIRTTGNIVDALKKQGKGKQQTLINTSAVGYYGFCGDETMFKDAPPGSDFLASICVDWEKEAGRASEAGVRVVTPRFATVLGKGGGALAKMLPVFRLGLGGPLGHGRQWFPWIHIHDLSRAILFLIEHNEISGPMNFSAPQTVRNREFTKILAKTLHRPAILPVPAFLIKLVLGELSSVFLEGCKVRPDVLTRHGFAFQFDGLESALTDLVG